MSDQCKMIPSKMTVPIEGKVHIKFHNLNKTYGMVKNGMKTEKENIIKTRLCS